MRVSAQAIVTLVAAVLLMQQPRAQAPQPDEQPPGTAARFATAAQAVLVDVVVRDRRGRPVTDLTDADFTVSENGTPQTILSFERRLLAGQAVESAIRPIRGGTDKGNNPTAAGTEAASGGVPSVVALAFDRLTPEGRDLAHRAAKSFVESKQPEELGGVFVVDMALRTILPYTTNTEQLADAVKTAAETATSQMARERNPLLDDRYSPASTPAVAGAEQRGRPSNEYVSRDSRYDWYPREQGADRSDIRIMRMLMRMDRTYQAFLYETQARTSIHALLSLVDSLGELPGRKTVIYFAEGLTVPSSVEPVFRSVIETANRQNVSVYALDAAGLRVHSGQMQTAREVRRLGATGIEGDRGDRKWTEDLEFNETILKQDPSASLGLLADGTGGQLIDNTNDLAGGIDRINEDRRFHYLLSYQSTNAALDGSYRRIDVSVKRPGLTVRARPGYLAVPPTAAPIFTYETGALAALAATPPPAAFPIRTRALFVPTPAAPNLTAVLVDLRNGDLTFTTDGTANTYAGEATVVARILDAAGKPVGKQSQQYVLTGAIADLERFKDGRLLFFRTPELPPGGYQVQAAVHDGKADRAAVATTSVTVPDVTPPLVGDLFLVASTERLAADDQAGQTHPLAANGLLLYPNLGDPISKRAASEIAFALPLVLDAGGPTPEATLQVAAQGQTLAEIPFPLGAPDAQGRLLAVGRLPSAAFPAGEYELRAIVKGGAEPIVRSTTMRVVD